MTVISNPNSREFAPASAQISPITWHRLHKPGYGQLACGFYVSDNRRDYSSKGSKRAGVLASAGSEKAMTSVFKSVRELSEYRNGIGRVKSLRRLDDE